MEMEKMWEMVKAMAEEISTLRNEYDLECGYFNKEEYKIENIIKEYYEEFFEEN